MLDGSAGYALARQLFDLTRRIDRRTSRHSPTPSPAGNDSTKGHRHDPAAWLAFDPARYAPSPRGPVQRARPLARVAAILITIGAFAILIGIFAIATPSASGWPTLIVGILVAGIGGVLRVFRNVEARTEGDN